MNLLHPKNIKLFRDYLQKQYEKDIQLIDARGIQDVYKELITLTGAGQMVKDMKENREYIDGIKKLLTD